MKALGIIAMIFSVVCIFVPVAGAYLTVVGAALAAFSAKDGVTFGAMAIGINFLNVLFLSPSIWVTDGVRAIAGMGGGIGEALLLIHVVSVVVLAAIHMRGKRQAVGME